MSTAAQVRSLGAVARAIIETVREAGPLGAPAGIIYAALSAHGCGKDLFDWLMQVIVDEGLLTKRGDCYHTPRATP